MTGRIHPTLREALHSTATTFRDGMKRLASELDWSPSELSMRTTLGGDSARPFPADDEHFVRLMKVTGDYSPLLTLCDLLGFEPPQPKRDRLPEMLAQVTVAAEALGKQIQQLTLFAAEQMRQERRK